MPDIGFNTGDYDPSGVYDALPAGWAKAYIKKSEIKPLSTGRGKRLVFERVIIGGEYAGRVIFEGHNIQHEKKQTQDIARSEIRAVCDACNVVNPRDSSELHNVPHMIRIAVKRNKETDELQNEIKGYKKISDQQPAGPYAEDAPQPQTTHSSVNHLDNQNQQPACNPEDHLW